MAKTQGNKKKKILIGTISGVVGLGIVAGVTIPLVMCAPKSQIDVTFDADGQEGVTFEGETHIKVNEGTTFEEVRSKIVAKKVVSGTTYPFSHWYKKGDSSKSRIADTFKVNESITVCPAFEQEPVPVEDFQIFFTAAPGEQGVKISAPSKTIKKGQTFAKVKNEVTATKTTTLGKWQFQWWYKDGDSPEHKMVDDVVLGNDPSVTSLTVHPYFLPPVAKYVVTFSDGGDPNIKFNKSQLTYTATDGTTLESLLSSSGIEATKEGWIFKHWTLDLKTEKEWEKPSDYGKGSPINENITLYPYFEEPEEAWKPKQIVWEKYTGQTEEFPKHFVLPPAENDAESVSTSISNFVLQYNPLTMDPVIAELQEREELIVEATNTSGGDFHEVQIDAKLLDPSPNLSPEKQNVEFTFSNLPSEEKRYTGDITFDVTFSFKFKGEPVGNQCVIPGLSVQLSDPWEAPEIGFTKSAPEVTTFETAPNSKSYFVDHTNEQTGHFWIDRPLDNSETLEVKVLGNDAENLYATAKVTNVDDTNAYIDVTVGFKEIKGIFETHKAEFQLEFITTHDGSGKIGTPSIPDNTFELVFTPDGSNPYSIVMDNTYVINGISEIGPKTVQVQIENNKTPYFRSGDYVTIRNKTREALAPGDVDESPIYFTSPQESYEYEGEEPRTQIPLQGQDVSQTPITFSYQFTNNENIPQDITLYETDLQIDFWNGNPGETKWEGEGTVLPEGVEHYDTINRTINFIFTPEKWNNYTSSDWIDYRSIAIVQSAFDKNENKLVQKPATAWYLSNVSEKECYFATAHDIKDEYEELHNTEKYTDYTFGFTSMGAAKPYFADGTKYLIIDNDISDQEVKYENNDMLRYAGDVEWADENGTAEKTYGDKLYWNYSGRNYAPNLAIFKLDTSNFVKGENASKNYEAAFKFRQPILNEWAKVEGHHPDGPGPSGDPYGQITTDFRQVPNDFSRAGFSNGYTAGFKSKVITINKDKPDERDIKVLYWTGFKMAAEIGELTYFDPLLYEACVGCDDKLFTNTAGQDVLHRTGAFVMTLDSFKVSQYFDDAGRGAMFILRQYVKDGEKYTKELMPPKAAGINWNGRSHLNWKTTITPYFDVWQFGGQQKFNLLALYLNPRS